MLKNLEIVEYSKSSTLLKGMTGMNSADAKMFLMSFNKDIHVFDAIVNYGNGI